MARVTAESQVKKLRVQLEIQKVTHNEVVLADISGLRVVEGIAYFCTANVQVRRVLQVGDGGALPTEATISFRLPREGRYDVKNVRVFSNGRIALTATPETEIVSAPGHHLWR